MNAKRSSSAKLQPNSPGQPRLANLRWKFPLRAGLLATGIFLAVSGANHAFSQKKGKQQEPAPADSLVASRANGYIMSHSQKSGESISFLGAREIPGSESMGDTTFVRFQDRLILNKYDVMKLEKLGCMQLRSYRLYYEAKTGILFIFEAKQAAPKEE